jgi:hypothetical protein
VIIFESELFRGPLHVRLIDVEKTVFKSKPKSTLTVEFHHESGIYAWGSSTLSQFIEASEELRGIPDKDEHCPTAGVGFPPNFTVR